MLQAIPCPLCKNEQSFLPIDVPDTDLHIQKYGNIYAGEKLSAWKICGQCGFVHQNPRPTVAELNRLYEEGKYHPSGLRDFDELMSWAPEYMRDEVAWAIEGSGLSRGRVFDIGCGLGVTLHLFRGLGWETVGVEPDAAQYEFARTRLGLTGIKPGILDADFELDEKVDLVFTHHAFEHFADLDGVMLGIRNILKPGGYVFTTVPTYYQNQTKISKEWMNSAHYSLFTHNSLNNLFARHGIEEVAHRYGPWRRKPDQFCHLAKLTGATLDPAAFYEDPREVDHYLRVTNPLRSLVQYPRYGALPERAFSVARQVSGAVSLFASSPTEFYRRVKRRTSAR